MTIFFKDPGDEFIPEFLPMFDGILKLVLIHTRMCQTPFD